MLSQCSEQMPKSLSSAENTDLSLPQFPFRYEIIDEEKPTHAGFSRKHVKLRAAARDPSITRNASNGSPSDERPFISNEKSPCYCREEPFRFLGFVGLYM